MRTGNLRTLSERDYASIREMRQFMREEEKKERDRQDREQYQAYLADLEAEQSRTPKALRIQPLSFEEWRKFMPDEAEADASVRGVIATNRSLLQTGMMRARDLVSGTLDDDELEVLHFDLRRRLLDGRRIDREKVKKDFAEFVSNEPRYDHEKHFEPLNDFLHRHKLYPTVYNVDLTFRLLILMAVIAPKEPEPPRDPALNEYGVNLGVERSPDFERQQRRRDYYDKVVLTDRVTKRTYTEAQLDRLSADEYRRLVFGDFRTPTIRDVIKPNIK